MMGEMGGFDAVALQKYHTVEKIDHVHTGGNSSGIVDGAALVLVGSEKIGKELGLTPRARIVAAAVIGSEPTIMLTGPARRRRRCSRAPASPPEDIDLYELNEAFASVVLKYQRDLKIPDEKLNVNGGAIAMGHPLGATGAVILGTVVDELERRKAKRYAVVTLCVGGGMGIATIIERSWHSDLIMSTMKWENNEGIVTLTMDDPSQSANTMNAAWFASMKETVDRLVNEKDAIKGVILTSAKKTFFAGGDLKMTSSRAARRRRATCSRTCR